MQSAEADIDHWRLDWDILPGSGRWENPLIGWASSADYMQGEPPQFLRRLENGAEPYCVDT
jgi:NADH dehydrogenase (ubiquinone) Fe-S protein 4